MQATFKYAIKYVDDMDKAVAFHRDVLGLTLRFQTPFWTEFDTGPVTLGLLPSNDLHPAGKIQLGFTSSDVQEVFAGREASGLTFTQPPYDEHGMLVSRLLDCEGVEFSLSTPRP